MRQAERQGAGVDRQGTPDGWLAAGRVWAGRFQVPPERWREFLRARGEGGVDDHGLSELYLVCGCALGLDPAIAEFERCYFGELDRLVACRFPSVAADEARQLVRVRLFGPRGDRPPRVAEYSGRGGLRRWLKVAAARTLLNHVTGAAARREALADPSTLLDQMLGGAADPELEAARRHFGPELKAALAEGFAGLGPEQRSLLRRRYVEGASIDELGAHFGVHRATIVRRLAAAREQLLDSVRTSLEHRLVGGAQELRSLVQLVRSQLGLSLSACLRSDPSGGG